MTLQRSHQLPPSLGKYVCQWIEANLVHAEGDFLGQPFRLDPFQKRIVYRIYAYDPTTLKRIVRRFLGVMPKGCGKTELMAALSLAELAGPVHIDPQSGRPTRRLAPKIPVEGAKGARATALKPRPGPRNSALSARPAPRRSVHPTRSGPRGRVCKAIITPSRTQRPYPAPQLVTLGRGRPCPSLRP